MIQAMTNSQHDQNRSSRKIAYIVSEKYLSECDRNIKVLNRASMTHSLIEAYELTSKLTTIEPKIAREDELMVFHSRDYIQHLKSLPSSPDFIDDDDDSVEYGLGYDCPIFEDLFSYVCSIAGGTITAAHCLIDSTFNVVINWGGGWHHAKKDEAAGFCYVNDIVLGILVLKEKFDKVLYIDLDVHHGDGVEDAFAFSAKVMTVSFHKYEDGFYPGSGYMNDVGFGKGKYSAVNIPLRDGIRDEQYFDVFSKVMTMVKKSFQPSVVVCQCGADGLAGDPMQAFNLTPVAFANCVQYLLGWNLPILFLGGGGYNVANVARCWTYLTSIITQTPIANDIPENTFFLEYGPDFTLEVTPGNRSNKNDNEYIDCVLCTISHNLHITDDDEFCEFV